MSVKGWSKGENTIVQSRLKISYMMLSHSIQFVFTGGGGGGGGGGDGLILFLRSKKGF